mgnify:CR=1 FL=1
MSEHDDRLAELYKQTSQETPTAQVDRAVLNMARKSVHRKLYAPFGASWLVRGATVGVMVLGVLLVLTLPEQESYLDVPKDVPRPASVDSDLKEERTESDALSIDGAPLKRKQPATEEGPRFDFYELLPEVEVEVPDEKARSRVQQAPSADEPARKSLAAPAAPAAEKKAVSHYIQAGSFQNEQRAIDLRDRLTGLGYRASVAAVTLDDGAVYYRVRVGPYEQEAGAAAARQQLDALGLETRQVLK